MRAVDPNVNNWKFPIWLITLLLVSAQVVGGFTETSPPAPYGIEKRHNDGSAVVVKQSQSPYSELSGRAGASALTQVQFLASKVAESTEAAQASTTNRLKNRPMMVRGTGGNVFNNAQFNRAQGASSPSNVTNQQSPDAGSQNQVWTALAQLELDMEMLDTMAGQKPQLTALEFTILSLTVAAAGSGPWIGSGALTEVLAPAACAVSAAIGIGAEYVGRVNVADGKEVAAATLQCAAEAEGMLANAERSKCIAPLCVGLGATATAIALLVPVLLGNLGDVVKTEVYLACPLVSVLAAAVASLALQETKVMCQRATSVGNRRWAKSGLVGRTWLSTSEQIVSKSRNAKRKWQTFAFSVLPAPILGALIPGATLASKAIIITAFAAAQSAFFLTQCEYWLARATDAVAVKSRSAAVCDTYANQGARSAAILPFTSALSGLCAAATAAIVELPFVEALSAAGTVGGVVGEAAAVSFFPAFSALFAAAASVSKARCEVHAEAATQAASTLALEYSEGEDPILRPIQGVKELIQITCTSSIVEPFQGFVRRFTYFRPLIRLARWFKKRVFKQSNDNSQEGEPVTA